LNHRRDSSKDDGCHSGENEHRCNPHYDSLSDFQLIFHIVVESLWKWVYIHVQTLHTKTERFTRLHLAAIGDYLVMLHYWVLLNRISIFFPHVLSRSSFPSTHTRARKHTIKSDIWKISPQITVHSAR